MSAGKNFYSVEMMVSLKASHIERDTAREAITEQFLDCFSRRERTFAYTNKKYAPVFNGPASVIREKSVIL